MMKVGIIGASGYTGGELLRILARHPECEVSCATSRRYTGMDVSKVSPNLKGIMDLKFEDISPDDVASRSDFVFTATPHGTSMDIVPKVAEMGVKVVDLSGDFRFKDIATYEKYYGNRHNNPKIKAVYGLPELHRKEIKGAKIVANPGCYPTGAILGLVPLLKEGLIESDRIAVDSKSGISGAGASPSLKTHFSNADECVLAYNVAAHRHMPEIEQELRIFDKKSKVSFVPHIVPVIRGLTTTLHCYLNSEVSSDEIKEVFDRFYQGKPFVRVLEVGNSPRMSAVRGSNYIDIGCLEVDKERQRTIVVTALDNLVKGASGQAVQNMNLMAGFEETVGLKSIGIHP
ncbi:MAG: N-acetyl-gamma-glutamyl-phosphate reductase [Candidatus Hydrothermarchaeales archaeon]